MTWWLWILFWCVFWSCAGAYLTWRAWRVWPHARAFARTCAEAMERVETARSSAADLAGAERSHAVVRSTSDDLAWNRPASSWRDEHRARRTRRREVRLDDHTAVWASWRDQLD